MSWPQETLKVAVLSDSRMWNMILRHWWHTHIQVWCPRCLSFWRRWRSSLAWSNSQTPPFLGHPLCSMEQPWYSSGYPLDHVSFQFRSHLPCGFLAEFNKFASVPMIDCSFHLPTTIHTHFVKYDVNWLLKIRPHRRCWGVIFRMALVKGYRFTWRGGGAFFGQNLLFLIGRDARLQKTL